MKSGFLSAFVTIFIVASTSLGATSLSTFVLDDFQSTDGTSSLGTLWSGITDQVMGGRSQMNGEIAPYAGERALRVTGRVSLENNGGFIQARLGTVKEGRAYDAGRFQGIYLRYSADPGSYFVHLRTRRNRAPWSYYQAKLEASESWNTLYIPWNAFLPKASNLRSIDVGEITSIAVVAAENEFDADIRVSEIGFY